MTQILIIDNYDSFTFNLVQQIGSLGAETLVYRNDSDLNSILSLKPTHLVISPGPGNPSHTGISRAVIEYFQGQIPILGVCLGLQLIGEMNGAEVIRAPEPIHGQTDSIVHDGKGIFKKLSLPTKMARYHSLVLNADTWPSEKLEITARTPSGLVMGLRHRLHPHLEAVQFHPESFMSPEGDLLMRNFLSA